MCSDREERAPACTGETPRAAALRAAIETGHGRSDIEPVPDFSDDGGVTVGDAQGHTARIQPLGQRARITLADPDGFAAEGEVDNDTLVARIAEGDVTYDAVAEALDVENGPEQP